ncbi:hypothetical protein [Mucilaginibacter terrae]|uniref:Uncharacterized protein n=1 Tax=Mucilaginibacter terrae TaxID=1955052 RepID=A0ABU3GS34_9SPHI|nr:hypothetical protein [Mucilaginibacter terrae]MDT3401450.1 hypothetical protein [Mucilaginibacter terrae]
MTMGDNYEQKPLLKVILEGRALERAVKDHYEFSRIDSMVKSPLGNTFTAVGLLKMSNAPYMKITNPQNIMIGPFARLEKP